MDSLKVLGTHAVAPFVLLVCATPGLAQPSLSSLWPVDIGRAWEYDLRVEGPFDELQTGSLNHTVVGHSELSSGVTIACFDVESSVASEELPKAALQAAARPSRLLAVSPCTFDVGVLVEDEVAMGSWSDGSGDWVWWWMTADLAPGSSFQLPILTSIRDDAFVGGEVRTITGSVSTPAGSFDGAVIVDYLVGLGESEITRHPSGEVIGTARFEVSGWIAFVPGVGPVKSEETIAPAEIDCPECPADIYEPVTMRLELRSSGAVPAEPASFGRLKARY